MNYYVELTEEMEIYLKFRDIDGRTRKKHKHSKPYWCPELEQLWIKMRDSEKLFRKCMNIKQKTDLHHKYKNSCHIFNKRLRQLERSYNRSKTIEIEQICTKNPKEFWEQIKKLGPRKSSSIPMKVKLNDDSVTSEPSHVLETWKTAFDGLYNNRNTENFHPEFLKESNE